MRLTKQLLLAAVISTALISCEKKDDDSPDSSSSSCPNNVSFCMDYGSVNKSGNATLKEPPGGRFRIFWENATATEFEQVEMDIYATAAGTYPIDTSNSAGSAFFQYFSNISGANNGVSGSVEITQFDPNGAGLSGTFQVSTQNGTNITQGRFVNVTK